MTTGFAVCGMPFPGEGFAVGTPAPPGSGTVTSVSVVTANGVSGTVANPTTTPAITITLGNITPTSVNTVVISGASTPTLTVTGTTTVSGNNTGDQIEFPDNTFRIYDNTVPTKKVAFETSGITPAITRTLTVPDENGTITLNTATQTLTNKTVVTPIIQTGMELVGGTSGTVTIDVPAIITDYSLILPPAQGTGSLTNDGAGNLSWGGTAGIVGWTPALNTSVPNNTVNASTFTASGGTTNQDAVVQPKGTGAFILQLPDNTATGGNKRGDHAIDLQTGRTVATRVASGQYSFVAGYDNTATQNMSIAIGNTNTSTGNGAIAMGDLNIATGQASVAIGSQNTAGGINAAVALGKENVASGENSTALGYLNTASGDFASVIGASNSNAGAYSIVMGQGLTFTSAADNSFGFLSNPSNAVPMTIAAPNTTVFGNTNLWLANNDNTARELRFYEPYNTTGAFPNTANYTAFKAQAQSADVTYTLPAADGSSGNVLSTNGSGVLSWTPAAAGSVTTVSVVTANGISGTVANPTTTPAITLALAGITPSLNTSSPNNVVNASRVLATGGTTDQDLVLQPKGVGAFMLNLPDNTATGGNKRGVGAIDLNLGRDTADQVASGDYSFTAGYGNNTGTAVAGIAIGDRNSVTATSSIAMGYSNTAGGGNGAVVIGYQSSASGESSATFGRDNVSGGAFSVALGQGLTLTSNADKTFGFLANDGANVMTIDVNNVFVVANADLWLANNDNTARELRFYEPYKTPGAFPNTANYTAFKAQAQSADVTYTLPAADGSSGNVLTTNGSGVLSWTTAAAGTVTTVSVVTANGVSGSVANATTTPAITITLGAITPTTVNGMTITTTTGTLTLASGSSLVTSGANSITFTSTGPTTVTLPTTGTLMANPMTTGGDVIYGGASGAPTRLANGSIGQVLTSAGGTSAPTWSTIVGLTGFTSSLNTASPNNLINASLLIASGGTTNQDAVIQPKGTGAFQNQLADGTSTGGNKRGQNAIDLQTTRTAADQVASGTASFAAGSRNKSSADYAVAIGRANTSSAQGAICIGDFNTASVGDSIAIGNSNSMTGGSDFAIGSNNTSSGSSSGVLGAQNTMSGNAAFIMGLSNNVTADFCFALGYKALGSYQGQFSHANGQFTATGDAQISELPARNITTDATQTELFLDGSSVRLGVPSGKTYAFEVRVSGRRTDTTGFSYHAVIEGTISNNSGTTALDGLNTMRVITNTAGTWSAVVEADNTNDALVVKVTGESGATIRWVAAIKLVEVAS